ncbi:hypothetical protein [Vagococcus zengguangii]|uniref:DUF1659 domain-containing protein n=1 Tax=Vagococcus zengguangii TaxID=2571750 RepID=UPI001108F2DC|nr:hypothetical protein [Vagococcus zengguangii]TLG80964.1 hypothetical protein FE258_03510 [Vagococcus zengguangii]
MKQWESTSLEVYFDVEGEASPKKVSLRNVVQEPEEEAVKGLGQTLGTLSPEEQSYNSSVIVNKSRVL